ncbi:MAG TPA: Crp/Fnr family transcriptional regulator [Ideonella sp.]|nr:Crp/Fnr family transcriptional regulator [Ideonella sp.]
MVDAPAPPPSPRRRTGAGEARRPPADPLAALSPTLRALAERGEQRKYRKHTVLIHEGDQGDSLYIILSGRLRAFSVGENNREITYGVYEAGEFQGEMSLDGGPRSASVETLETSVCVLITRRTLTLHIAEHPEFAFELLAKVIRRARAATLSAKQLALNDVYGRLKALLDALAVPRPDGTRVIERRLTQQEMAGHLGCVREMVSKVMTALERGGYLVVSRQPGVWLVLPRVLPGRF